MGRDTVQLETAVNTISQEYLLEFTSEYGIPEMLHPELPGPEDRIVDFPEGKVGNNRFFWVDERVFPTVVDWRTNAPKDRMLAENTYSVEPVRALDTHRTPIQKLPEMLLYRLVGCSIYYREGPFGLCPRGWGLGPGNHGPGGAAARGCATDAPRAGQAKEVAATDPSAATKSHKRGRDGADVNAPPKVLRRDHADPRPTRSTHEGKILATIELGLASTRPVPMPENAPAGMSDLDLLSFADPSRAIQQILPSKSSQGIAIAGDPNSGNASSTSAVGSSKSIYRPEWGVANGSMLDTPEACQDLVDHVAPPGYFSELCHLDNDDFLRQYKVNLARQVATLQEQVNEKEKLKAAFEEFKRYEDTRVEQRCAEMDARLDALSIDFDEELYPHMLTAIASRRQAFADVVSARIAKGMSKGLRHGVDHGQTQLTLKSIEAYNPEAKDKYVAALQALKDLKYPLVDQLEGLKDAPMDVIMAALYLESNTGNDAPQHIRDLRPSSSQLTIPMYPEVRGPMNQWAYKEEMLLADAIAANISHAEKKKKCRIVCRTHGVGSAQHTQSDGVPVSVPIVVPQGLVILLADAATQTELEEAT
nr:hypothetical protein [Tanacetum cinerariifolium]